MRPSRNQALMDHARVAATRSTCSRASVGVVLARDGRVLVTGYNGAPAGMAHCDHYCDCHGPMFHSLSENLHRAECNSRRPCTVAVHAEANAIAYAARWGIATDGAELFTTFTPCLPCAQIIVNAGITRVVYATHYRDISGLHLCESAGIKVVHEELMDAI